MFTRTIPFAHEQIKKILKKDDVAVDMTAGNGHDTLFLATLSSYVYAFDIQSTAIEATSKLLQEHHLSHVHLIKDCHSKMPQYVNQAVKVFVFNLGYLPGSNKEITTLKETTLRALNESLKYLCKGGLISITAYTGHKEGMIETKAIESFLTDLPSNEYTVLKYQFLNRHNAPYNLLIFKHE